MSRQPPRLRAQLCSRGARGWALWRELKRTMTLWLDTAVRVSWRIEEVIAGEAGLVELDALRSLQQTRWVELRAALSAAVEYLDACEARAARRRRPSTRHSNGEANAPENAAGNRDQESRGIPSAGIERTDALALRRGGGQGDRAKTWIISIG